MKTLTSTKREVLTEYGFYVVNTECGELLNICLSERADGNGYKKEIEDDGGYDSGICGDANEKAIEKYGSETVLAFLLKEARKDGIKTVC